MFRITTPFITRRIYQIIVPHPSKPTFIILYDFGRVDNFLALHKGVSKAEAKHHLLDIHSSLHIRKSSPSPFHSLTYMF